METAVNLDPFLDPHRRGYLKAGVLLTPRQFAEAGRLDLKNHKGISLKLIQPSPDPLSTKVLRLQAPVELGAAVALAESRYTDAEKICEQVKARWEGALNAKAQFVSDMAGSTLTDAGTQRALVLDGNIERAAKDFRESEDLQQQTRIERLQAEQRLEGWARAEGLRRAEEARQAAAALKNPPPLPLSAKLSRLKKKILK